MNFGAKVAKGKVFFSLTYVLVNQSAVVVFPAPQHVAAGKKSCYYHAHKLHCTAPIHLIDEWGQHVFNNHACLPYLSCTLFSFQHVSSNFDVPAVLQGICYASCMQTPGLLTS